MKGQCFCGAIKYEVSSPLKFVVHDHCSMCRRISGAAFVTWGGVMEGQLKVVSGAPKLNTYESSSNGERQFCSQCGSHLFFRGNRWPGEVHFTVATLIDQPELPPKAHVYFSNKVKWLDINDSLPKLGGKSGNEPLDKA